MGLGRLRLLALAPTSNATVSSPVEGQGETIVTVACRARRRQGDTVCATGRCPATSMITPRDASAASILPFQLT